MTTPLARRLFYQLGFVALVKALNAGSLDYVALGPLTNLAEILQHELGLARNITRVVAVIGRRPGHRFHPSENRAAGAMLFGHGPIFRDLNAVLRHPEVRCSIGPRTLRGGTHGACWAMGGESKPRVAQVLAQRRGIGWLLSPRPDGGGLPA